MPNNIAGILRTIRRLGLKIPFLSNVMSDVDSDQILVCSDCFENQGLKLDARQIGVVNTKACPHCRSTTGSKLSRHLLWNLTARFFHWGTMVRCEYGAAPTVAFNDVRETDSDLNLKGLEIDMRLIEKELGIGFFHYGPRLWMIGEFEALDEFKTEGTRRAAIAKVLDKYPEKILTKGQTFYRVRKAPENPSDACQYDSPPTAMAGNGRIDSVNLPVLYGSSDLEVCVHECRVTAEDELYVATLSPTRNLRLLDLTELLLEEDVTEFESTDLAVHMLFLAGAHSYKLSRAIARDAHKAGYDGLAYPSYFSLLRTGAMPFETVLGISHRRIPRFAQREKSKTVANIAIFGRPIERGIVEIKAINRLMLNRVKYRFHFGPVGFAEES